MSYILADRFVSHIGNTNTVICGYLHHEIESAKQYRIADYVNLIDKYIGDSLHTYKFTHPSHLHRLLLFPICYNPSQVESIYKENYNSKNINTVTTPASDNNTSDSISTSSKSFPTVRIDVELLRKLCTHEKYCQQRAINRIKTTSITYDETTDIFYDDHYSTQFGLIGIRRNNKFNLNYNTLNQIWDDIDFKYFDGINQCYSDCLLNHVWKYNTKFHESCKKILKLDENSSQWQDFLLEIGSTTETQICCSQSKIPPKNDLIISYYLEGYGRDVLSLKTSNNVKGINDYVKYKFDSGSYTEDIVVQVDFNSLQQIKKAKLLSFGDLLTMKIICQPHKDGIDYSNLNYINENESMRHVLLFEKNNQLLQLKGQDGYGFWNGTKPDWTVLRLDERYDYVPCIVSAGCNANGNNYNHCGFDYKINFSNKILDLKMSNETYDIISSKLDVPIKKVQSITIGDEKCDDDLKDEKLTQDELDKLLEEANIILGILPLAITLPQGY